MMSSVRRPGRYWSRPGHRAGAGIVAAAAGLLAAVALGVAAAPGPEPAAGAAPAAAPLPDEQIVTLLQDYLRIDTSNPPGNELAAARFFQALFEREGISSEIFEFAPGRANIVARLRGEGDRGALLLSNHMDVVNAESGQWTVDPFGGILKEGYVYGRGAIDMKSTGILQAVAVINLKRSGVPLKRDLVFLGTADEEVEAAGIRWMTWEQTGLLKSVEFMLNEGGIIDGVGGKAFAYNVAVTEKAPFWIKIRAVGRAGHGSQPFEEDNAVLRLLRALDRLRRYDPPVRVTETAQAFFRARAAKAPEKRARYYRDIRKAVEHPAIRAALTADPATNAILRNTIAITMLEAAPQTNIIPSVAEARVDVRLLPGEDPGAFLAMIRELVERTGVTVTPIGRFRAATESPIDSELVRAIDRARQRHHPDAVLAPTMLTGWTESAALRPLGVKAYGFQPFVLSESEQERTHGNDERISVDNLLLGARIMEEIVRDLCVGPAPTARR